MKNNTSRRIVSISDTEAYVSKSFERKARIFGSEEYKLWKAYREDFPNAEMKTKTAKRSNSNRNLTYANMELYIREENPDLLSVYVSVKNKAKIQPNPYLAVVAWFQSQFPEYAKINADSAKTDESDEAA